MNSTARSFGYGLKLATLCFCLVFSLPGFSQGRLDAKIIESICGQVLEMTNAGTLKYHFVELSNQPTPDELASWEETKDDYAGTSLNVVHRFSYQGRTRVIGSVVGGG